MLPWRFGAYQYESEGYSGGPYRRSIAPIGGALRVESLPTGLRRGLAQVQLSDVDFRRDRRVPFEHLPSTISLDDLGSHVDRH